MDWLAFEQFARQIMRGENIPGMAVAVSHRGDVIYQKGFGVRDIETNEPVTPRTVFGIASVTKSFSALAIMKLMEQGRLSVDDPVKKYLPAFSITGVDNIEAIKIHHLLSHTTGIPPMRRRQDIEGFAGHLEFLASEDFSVMGPPGAYMSYCNDAFLLLGAIIERVAGVAYRDYITTEIIEPLGMSSSTIKQEELASLEDISTPYVFNKQKGELEKQPWPVLLNYEVGGGVRSCVLDLLKYGSAYFEDRNVSLSMTRKMYQPVHPIGRNTAYGYALKVTNGHNSMTLAEHGGGQPGVSANFGFVPEQELVVAILTNVTGVSAARIWLAAVNTALGLPLQYTVSAESPSEEPLPQDTEKYVGEYSSREGGKVIVSAIDKRLQVEFEGEVYDLVFAHDTTFFFNHRGQRVVRFYNDGNGSPWAAFVGLRMLLRK